MRTQLALAAGILAAVSLAAPRAHGFAEIARGKLTATARVTTEYDTSIFANNSEVSDWSAIFTPSLSYSRSAGAISTNAYLAVSAIDFQDTKGQDSVDPSLSVTFNMDRAEKGAFAQSISYARQTSANDILNARAESDEYRGVTKLDYYFSEKTGFRFNANYRLSDFSSTGYNGIRSYGLGGGVIYRYSPKLTAFLTGSYNPEKAVDLAANPVSNPSSKNYRIRLGLEGELAPKVNGSFAVGVVRREFDIGGNTEAMVLSSSLNWSAAEKTSVTLSASHDFDTSPGAESVRMLSTSLGVRQSLSAKLSIGGSLGWQHTRLNQMPGPIARQDDAITVGANANYRLSDTISLSGAFTHRDSDSTLARAQYTRDVASLSASFLF